MAPVLPAQKKAGARKAAPPGAGGRNQLPILHASEIVLEDGTKVSFAFASCENANRHTHTSQLLSLRLAQMGHSTPHTHTQIPVKIPPGMPPAQAEALLAYLQANPEAAKAAHAQVGGRKTLWRLRVLRAHAFPVSCSLQRAGGYDG